MFGLGAPELIVILVIALLVVGPNKLPQLASSIGKTIKEFKASSKEFTETVINPTIAPIKEAKQELERDVINPLKEGLDMTSEFKDINDNVLNPIKESVAGLDPTKSLNEIKGQIKDQLTDDAPSASANVFPDIPSKPAFPQTEEEKAAAAAKIKEDIAKLAPDFPDL